MSQYSAYPKNAYGPYQGHSYSRNGPSSWETQLPSQRQFSEGTVSNIRVKINDRFKLPPPIDFTRYNFREIQSTGFSFDFDFERALIEKYKEAKESRDHDPLEATQIVDPWAERIEKFVQRGYPLDAVCMALSVHHASPDDKVEKFLHAFDQMRTMGFDPFDATAALMNHQSNAGLAADDLLSAADGK